MAFPWTRKRAIDDQEDIEIKPEEIQKELGLDKINERLTAQESANTEVLTFVREQRQQREAAEARAQEEQQRIQQRKEQEEMPDFYTDPDKAIAERMKPLINNQINTNSILMRREIFDDPAFEYYDGETKTLIDRYIDSLPLSHRADPASIKNCYYTVMGQKMGEIKEGKLKSRFAKASAAASGTGASKGEPETVDTISQDEERVIREFGISKEDYIKNRRETNYV